MRAPVGHTPIQFHSKHTPSQAGERRTRWQCARQTRGRRQRWQRYSERRRRTPPHTCNKGGNEHSHGRRVHYQLSPAALLWRQSFHQVLRDDRPVDGRAHRSRQPVQNVQAELHSDANNRSPQARRRDQRREQEMSRTLLDLPPQGGKKPESDLGKPTAYFVCCVLSLRRTRERETKLWTNGGDEAVIARSTKRRSNLCIQAKIASRSLS